MEGSLLLKQQLRSEKRRDQKRRDKKRRGFHATTRALRSLAAVHVVEVAQVLTCAQPTGCDYITAGDNFGCQKKSASCAMCLGRRVHILLVMRR